mgnify:FL=1
MLLEVVPDSQLRLGEEGFQVFLVEQGDRLLSLFPQNIQEEFKPGHDSGAAGLEGFLALPGSWSTAIRSGGSTGPKFT